MLARKTFPLPPTLNEQINSARSHWSKSASTKKKWTNSIAISAIELPKFPGKVWLEFFYEVKSFARDADNVSASRKFLMDGLVQAGTIQKDSLMIVQSPILEWFDRGKVDQVTIVISDCPIVQSVSRRSI